MGMQGKKLLGMCASFLRFLVVLFFFGPFCALGIWVSYYYSKLSIADFERQEQLCSSLSRNWYSSFSEALARYHCSFHGIFASDGSAISFGVSSVTADNVIIVVMYSILIFLFLIISQLTNSAHSVNRSSESIRTSHRKWADSVYFLGFIYTLIALIFALSKTQLESGVDAMASTIAGNAIALSSTVVALFVRSVWTLALRQSRPSENTIEDELRNRARVLLEATLELEKGTKAFRTELAEASGSLSEYAKATDAAAEKVGASNEAMTSGISSLGNRISKVKIDETIVRDAFQDAFQKVIDGMKADLSNLSDSIGSGANQVQSALLDLEQALKFDPADVFGASVDEALKPLSRSLEKGSEKVAEGFSQIRGRLDQFGSAVDAATASTSKFSNGMVASTVELEAFRSDLTKLKGDLTTFRADALETVAEVAKSGSERALAALQPILADAKSAIGGVETMLSAVIAELDRRFEGEDGPGRSRAYRAGLALRRYWEKFRDLFRRGE